MRLPTDDEINRAAQQLGLADDNGVCPPVLRGRVAKSLLLAVADEDRDAARSASVAEAVADITEVHRRLAEHLPPEAATAITAALAPELYRSAHPERTPDNAAPRLDQPR